MLVLARTLNQRIVIGKEMELVVLSIRDNRVQLGITAPRTVPIVRREPDSHERCATAPEIRLPSSQRESECMEPVETYR